MLNLHLPIRLTMKKLIPVLFYYLFTSVVGFSQSSLSIVSWPGEGWGNTDANYIQVAGGVENISSLEIEVKVRAEEIDVVSGALHYFCWAQCYEPGVMVSPTSLILAPGERVNTFYGDYVPEGRPGISILKYCFFNVANEADSVCGIIRFNASPLSVAGPLANNRPNIGKAFPNPASDQVTMDYFRGAGNGRIEIYSMLGSKMLTVELREEKGRVRIPVDRLPAGMYLFRLNVSGEYLQTRKFHVSR